MVGAILHAHQIRLMHKKKKKKKNLQTQLDGALVSLERTRSNLLILSLGWWLSRLSKPGILSDTIVRSYRRTAHQAHLSLARSSGDTVGLSTDTGARGHGTRGGGHDGGVKIRNGSLAHASQRLARGALATLLVGSQVEGDEEDEVGAQDDDARKGSKLLTGTLSSVGHPGPVGRGEVGVRGEVDKA